MDIFKIKQAWVIIIVSVLISLNFDVHLPLMPLLLKNFDTSSFLLKQVNLAFLLGTVFSRFIWGALCDYIGRKLSLLLTIFIQICAHVGILYSKDIYDLIFWRFFQSLGAGVVTVIGLCVIVDIFKSSKELSKFIAFYEIVIPLSSVIAPIIGGSLVAVFNVWSASFVFMLYTLVFCFITVMLVLKDPNSYLKNHTNFKDLIYCYRDPIKDVRLITHSTLAGIIIAEGYIFFLSTPFIFGNIYHDDVAKVTLILTIPSLFSVAILIFYGKLIELVNENSLFKYGILIYWFNLLPYMYILFFNYSQFYFLLFINCLRSVSMSLILPYLVCLPIKKYHKNRGAAAALSSNLRTLVFYSITFIGCWVTGDSLMLVFLVKIFLIILSFFFIIWILLYES
jgi:DHA1 family bicyclomycin/chloramphenicol resistance-like MFS transporter